MRLNDLPRDTRDVGGRAGKWAQLSWDPNRPLQNGSNYNIFKVSITLASKLLSQEPNLHINHCALGAVLYPSASKCKNLINKSGRNGCRNAGNFHSLAHIVNTPGSKCWMADGNTHWPDGFMDVWILVAVHIAFRITFSSQWAKSWCSWSYWKFCH